MAKLFYGIIGWPLLQTFSPDYFHEKFARLGIDGLYGKFPLEDISGFPDLLKQHPGLNGLNVTIPHKTSVMPFLDAFSDDARAIGAVNCIDIRDGKLTGHNTDFLGFRLSLEPLLKAHHRQALILGTGGASKAIAYALSTLGIKYRFVSRGGDPFILHYHQLDRAVLDDYQLIINTTPLGMVPLQDRAPELPYELLGTDHLLYDIVYRASGLTPFLELGAKQGATVKDGLDMLHRQAELSWDIWSRG